MTKSNGKPCIRCNTSEWYRNGNCKECKRLKNIQWNDKNKDRRKQLNRQWAINNKDKHNERMKSYYKENRKYIRARTAVTSAILSGKLIHPSFVDCQDCKENKAKEYHHVSYDDDRLTDVIPLCTDCHGIHHRKYKRK